MSTSASARRIRTVAATVVILVTATVQGAPAIVPDPPSISAKSYILMDGQTRTVLAERDSDEPLPPASLTKIMTSFVAAAELSAGRIALDDQVPISVKAWRTSGSKMFVREGTEVSLNDLLRGIIIVSGNDASVAVAEYIAGAEDAFADMMNMHAKDLGMTASRFVNASGLPDDGHYSSAKDMAILSAALIERFPDHYRMYSEKSFQYGEIERPQVNRNRLLWRDKSVDGVKTGMTEAAGYCLVAAALREGTRLIAAVMGSENDEDRLRDTQKLLAYGFRYFETHDLYGGGEPLATPRVWYGTVEEVTVGIDAPIRITVPRGRYDDLSAVLDIPDGIEAPIAEGDTLGVVRVTLDDEVLAERSLLAQTAVPEAGFFSRRGDDLERFVSGLFSDSDEEKAPNPGTSPKADAPTDPDVPLDTDAPTES
ncbi:MAG: D-alanyl-D-alanine carboxypeptidase [Pseudomonadales bacterium]|nr:D-alanyl-D-alanine carboxypeptidase [Pseudomonadales bacterium]